MTKKFVWTSGGNVLFMNDIEIKIIIQKKTKMGFFFMPFTKINSRQVKDLFMKKQNCKTLRR